MRILHILDHSLPLHSGYSFRTASILTQQRRLGWETVQLTGAKHSGASQAEEEADGMLYYRTLPDGGMLERQPLLQQYAVVRGLARRLEQVARKERPDILHAHSPCLNGLAALQVGRRLDIPVVYELRALWEDAAVSHGTCKEGGLRYRLSQALETHVLRRVNAVTTICEGLRTEIVKRGITKDKVTIIPNAVNIEQFDQNSRANPAVRKELGLDGAHVIGFIGSFYKYEGLDLLLQATPRILDRCGNVYVVLVGGGQQEKALRDLAQRLGIAARVVFAGRVPHEKIALYYDAIDVLVYARHSMRLTELVTPLKPLEAMAGRRLFVASDVGGHRELIKDGHTGRLFRAGSAEALAEAVCEILLYRDKWSERLDAARRFVETERSWPASVSRYRPVYEQLIARRAMATT